MPESPIIRFLSVLVVMLVCGLAWYGIALAQFKRAGMEASAARAKAAEQAKRSSLVAVFLYLVFMVSLAGLFM